MAEPGGEINTGGPGGIPGPPKFFRIPNQAVDLGNSKASGSSPGFLVLILHQPPQRAGPAADSRAHGAAAQHPLFGGRYAVTAANQQN